MNINTSLIIRFMRFFSTIKLMEIAVNIGFLQRKRELLPETIVKVFVFGLLNIPNPSLNQIASKCEEIQSGLKISKTAIYNRLPKTALLLKQVFIEALQMSMKSVVPLETIPVLSQFRDVKICDSTKVSLPDKLHDIWPGLGGRNAKASLKIQGVYSLVKSNFFSLELTKAPGSDTTYTKDLLNKVKRGELLITDLGYFCKEFFNELTAQGAHFLSRIRKNAVVYIQKNGQLTKVDLVNLLKNKSIVDMEVILGVGYKEQLTCRLIAVRLPEDIVNERRRKANKKSKSQGKQISDYERELLAYNIVITDVSESILSAQAACDLYRARWQIELVFKALKSHLNTDKIGLCGRYQLECILYGRMIAATLIFTIYNALYIAVYSVYERGISIQLFTKLWANKSVIILQNLTVTVSAIRVLEHIFINTAKRSLHDKRRRKTTLEKLQEYLIPKNNYQNIA